MDARLTQSLADRYAVIALGHVTREFPNKLDHVLAEAGDVRRPRDLHPIFFGSFDWHSCVHSYWLLARLRRLFPEMRSANDIDALFARMFTAENIAGEAAYLGRPSSAGFERPYGWAWLLMLAAEFRRGGAARLKPLEDIFVARFLSYLPKLTYPIRAGTHGNTAFALILAADYARQAGAVTLENLMAQRARDWFGADRDAQAWEPGGDDFLSGALTEALCMQTFLPPAEFAPWFALFLPELRRGAPKSLFETAAVSDRSDGKIAHLDGFNLSRAWCLRRLAAALDDAELADLLLQAAERHMAPAMAHVAGDYMGEHWLATYALLALAPAD
jgi:hypothetical protein